MENYQPLLFTGETSVINRFILLGKRPLSPENYNLFDLKLESPLLSVAEIRRNDYRDAVIYDNINDYFVSNLSLLGIGTASYLFFDVLSGRELNTVLEFDMPGYSKLWINGKIAAVCDKRQNRALISAQLLYGPNSFVIEFCLKEKSDFPPVLYFQIYDYSDFTSGRIFPGPGAKSLTQAVTPVSIYDKEKQCIDFMLTSFVGGKRTITAKLSADSDPEKPKIYLTNEVYTYRLKPGEKDFFQLRLEGPEMREPLAIHTLISQEYGENLSKETSAYAENADGEIKTGILGRIEKAKDELTFTENRYLLFTEIRELLEGKRLCENSGTKRIYYRSEIDCTYREIAAHVPADYCRDKKYPLLLCLGISDFDYITAALDAKSLRESGCIVADCSGRGILGGGYISAACYLEALKFLQSRFNIDNDRIYLTGKSNGGYAVWSMLQNYPHLFAAAFPLSGYPNEKCIVNASNIYIRNYVSDMDSCYSNKKDSVSNALSPRGYYRQTNVHNLLHHTITDFSRLPVLEYLSGKKRCVYPVKISFVTEKNRYLRSYWICLHGILSGKKSAYIDAEIKSANKISITVGNAEGFSIELPMQIDKSNFVVEINKAPFYYRNFTGGTLHFRLGPNDRYIKKYGIDWKTDYRKGSGLLDVYLGSLRIIVPEEADDRIMKTARNFARPHSNGYYSKLSVNYPIRTIGGIRPEERSGNLVMIGTSAGDMDKTFAPGQNRAIETFPDGIGYKGEKFEGDYCVMQTAENPLNEKASILFIDTNNTAMLRRNIFIRKVILPFANTGIHEYWNNEALVMIGNVYYGIYEHGGELKKL